MIEKSPRQLEQEIASALDPDPGAVAGLSTTYPYEATSPGVARNQCEECGGWQRADKTDKGRLMGEITHGKRCESRPQPASVQTHVAERAAQVRRSDLEKFARNVRKHGLTKGRDQDVRDAVAAGLLTESEAMNTDD